MRRPLPTGDPLPKRLTIGKLRGLQQISDETGIFAMCAMDHRGLNQRLINSTAPEQVTHNLLGPISKI
jgi:tagatose-1,6-bisphosphate aldolase